MATQCEYIKYSITQQHSTCLKMVNFMFHMFYNEFFKAKSKYLGSSLKSPIV